MAVLKILIFPDQRLRTIAKEILVIDDEIKALAGNLLETMYEGKGIGLSATQANIHKRILVVDVSDEKDSPLILINPKIEVLNEEEEVSSEGCLSVPGFFEEVSRPSEINITALNLEGEKFTIVATGLLAVAVQHEMDHLDGKIFVDFLSNLKRQRIKKKLLKISKVAV
ncbi:MAG TPA: peptide deformylase [Gammaproteobacteria bacterium]|jgi:peptide deformylase|nr:peptide deformylase [Gammaproteobacteria bacterium]HIG49786.1 peptide deformylase [Gammaproteobacteria bacterium]